MRIRKKSINSVKRVNNAIVMFSIDNQRFSISPLHTLAYYTISISYWFFNDRQRSVNEKSLRGKRRTVSTTIKVLKVVKNVINSRTHETNMNNDLMPHCFVMRHKRAPTLLLRLFVVRDYVTIELFTSRNWRLQLWHKNGIVVSVVKRWQQSTLCLM